MDLATVDKLLTTTRTVRRRLDLARPVPPEVIEACLEVAVQAPTGAGYCAYHFLVLSDRDAKHRAGDVFRKASQWQLDIYADRYAETDQMLAGIRVLMDRFEDVPLWICCCVGPQPVFDPEQPIWRYARLGSIYPATWSLMLALRARGLGSAWTSIHVRYEDELKQALGVPEPVSIAALLPAAYYTGDDFQPAKRVPARRRTYWNTWQQPR
jgi:nitroreductase